MSLDETQEFLEAFAVWRHEGLVPLTFIGGYCTLLLEGQAGTLTPKQREYIEKIQRHSLLACSCWNIPLEYLRVQSGPATVEWEEIELVDAVEHAVSRLNGFQSIKDLEIDLPQTLPLVQGNYWLGVAIANVIASQTLSQPHGYPTTITASVVREKDVIVQIYIEKEPTEISEREMSYPGTHLSVASLVIQQLYNSQLEAHPLATGIKFQFTLQGQDQA